MIKVSDELGGGGGRIQGQQKPISTINIYIIVLVLLRS